MPKLRSVLLSSLFVSLALTVSKAHAIDLTSEIDQLVQKFGMVKVASERDADKPARGNRSFVYNTSLHVPDGEKYVILTDMNDELYESSMSKLSKAHSAETIQLESFRNLVSDAAARQKLVERLRKAHPKFIAIVPRIENFSENVVLAIWEVLVDLGGGSINVYPSFLVGFDPDSFAGLIDRSVDTHTAALGSLNPFIVAQSTNASAGGARAIQKAMFMQQLFDDAGCATKGLIIRTPNALQDDIKNTSPFKVFDAESNRNVMSLPPESQSAVANSKLLIFFGHGSPGMTCSLDVSAFRRISFDNDIVLSGSCFSAAPPFSDIASMASTVGRHSAPFFRRAITNGARVFYGHMHENGGFPELFVVCNSLLSGETVGQGYQRLMNANIGDVDLPSSAYVMNSEQLALPQAVNRRNKLLYIMIGDPASIPISLNTEPVGVKH